MQCNLQSFIKRLNKLVLFRGKKMGSLIKEYLKKQGYQTASDETYAYIDEWQEWYEGNVEKFHKYKIFNGTITTSHERYRMGMAKKVCEDWANLLFNEKVAIKAGDYEKRLHEILERNNFLVRANQLIELAFALGTGAFVEYKDSNDDTMIDYVRAGMIHPLAWENGEITECAFGSNRTVEDKEVIYLQIHRLGKEEEGENPEIYYIENKYVEEDSGDETDIPDDMEVVVKTESTKPLFQIIMPNICNNVDLDSPLGISVYANSIDQLKGCDLVYDSYINEFILGRKRILVPISMAKMQMQKDGITAPSFDPDDTVYYQMPGDRQSDLEIKEIDMKIRATEHELGIQRSLDILSLKAGMGTGRYKFDSSGLKTATEVISDKSDLYQNRQKNAIIINTAIVNMVAAISFLDIGKEVEATVDFDDSIIEDTNTTIDRNIRLVQEGLRSKLTAIMEINKCSEEEAKKELDRITKEGQITGENIDWTDMGDDEDTHGVGKEEDGVEGESSEESTESRAD